jgi:hypothetical protein
MAELTAEQLEVLQAVGLKGATEMRVVDEAIDRTILAGLVDGRYVWIDTIVLNETQTGDLALQAPAGIRVYYLTPLGAEAIGEDPQRIGLA